MSPSAIEAHNQKTRQAGRSGPERWEKASNQPSECGDWFSAETENVWASLSAIEAPLHTIPWAGRAGPGKWEKASNQPTKHPHPLHESRLRQKGDASTSIAVKETTRSVQKQGGTDFWWPRCGGGWGGLTGGTECRHTKSTCTTAPGAPGEHCAANLRSYLGWGSPPARLGGHMQAEHAGTGTGRLLRCRPNPQPQARRRRSPEPPAHGRSWAPGGSFGRAAAAQSCLLGWTWACLPACLQLGLPACSWGRKATSTFPVQRLVWRNSCFRF